MAYRLWIDGKWADAEGGKPVAVQNPATEDAPATVVDASSRDVDRAARATQALPAEAAGDYRVTKHGVGALP